MNTVWTYYENIWDPSESRFWSSESDWIRHVGWTRTNDHFVKFFLPFSFLVQTSDSFSDTCSERGGYEKRPESVGVFGHAIRVIQITAIITSSTGVWSDGQGRGRDYTYINCTDATVAMDATVALPRDPRGWSVSRLTPRDYDPILRGGWVRFRAKRDVKETTTIAVRQWRRWCNTTS